MGINTDRIINNIYRLPPKINRLGEIDYLSVESPNNKVESCDSVKNISSHENIEFIKSDSNTPFDKRSTIHLIFPSPRK